MEYTEEALANNRKFKEKLSGIIEKNKTEIEGLIRKIIKERWRRGESITGGEIINRYTGKGGYENEVYRNIKKYINPSAGGKVDLTLRGTLGDKIALVKYADGTYNIISKDSKYYQIAYKYGDKEFGLNPKETQLVMDRIEEIIMRELNF